jgi:DNA-binding NtrC family response regulator/predicted ATPase/class 3 adenylate cyclase
MVVCYQKKREGVMAHPRPRPPSHPTDRIVGNCPAIQALRAQIRHLATFDTLRNPSVPTVLLHGETGTGKGLVARVIHDSGLRAQGPFLDVNCAAIPETLLEAELFGYETGAFTDARRPKPGLFEAASGGTLFLDEIDALPLALQGKLLTAIEAKRVRRVGAVREQQVDVKLIAATQAQLSARIADGQFRIDLYHRLAVVLLELPPLHARGEDILVLAQQFLQQFAAAHRLPAKRLSRAAAGWLQRSDWPGNARELSHLMERVTLLSPEAIIDPQTLERLCLPRSPSAAPQGRASTQDEREPLDESARITQALLQTKGNVVQAARLLGLSRKALRYRMRRHGIGRPDCDAETPSAPPAARLTPHPTLSPSRREGQTLVPSPQRREGQGEGMSVRRGAEEAMALAPAWEQKPVAVLAIEMTWPAAFDALRYEPWTVSARWEQALVKKVQGFGGVVLQQGPSLLLVAFGLPHTQEQLPQRAVQTALAIRQMATEGQAGQEREPRPMVRQAVHWGQVLVDVGASDPTPRVLPIEETLAWPVRLLGQAVPGEILLSSQVGRLVEGWFELQAYEEPLAVYSVAGLRSQCSPLAIYGTRPLSQFVGRARELTILEDLLEQVEGVAGARLLVLATYRPGYRPPWIEKSYATQMVLQPLSSQASRQMLRSVLQMEDIPERLAQIILAKAQGNPFFLEEIVQALVEQGVLARAADGRTAIAVPISPDSLPALVIPSTVQGVLTSRLDRLPPEERTVLQTLAVVGNGCTVHLLTQVTAQPAEVLRQRLSHLRTLEFLYERPGVPESTYTFKHVLTQDVAYTSVPSERRRRLHERTAQAIEALFHDRLGEHYSELAHHYRHSGNMEKAVVYLYLAGEQAVQRSAYGEAISLCTTGLELITTLPDTPERARQELDLLLFLGPALMASRGYTAPEVAQVYARAQVLCEHVEDTPKLFQVVQGLCTIANQRGEFQTQRELAEQLLGLAQRLQDPTLLLVAHRVLGTALFCLGELTLAYLHLEKSFALYDRRLHGSLAVLYGQDRGVSCLRYLARILWLLGYPDQALQRIQEALTLARTLAHPQSLAEALCHMAHIHRLRREVPQTLQWAEAAMAHAREQGFPVWLSIGVILQGWALAMQSHGAIGMAQMHEVWAAVQATRRVQGQPSLLAWLAEGYLELGQAEEGLSMIAEALAVVHTAGERFYEAELYRLKGELLLVCSAEHSMEAETCFHQALDVARRQQAKSLELRAVASLSRLWRQQGKREEARQLLGEIYAWVTEGFDTADLQEVKALLEDMG